MVYVSAKQKAVSLNLHRYSVGGGGDGEARRRGGAVRARRARGGGAVKATFETRFSSLHRFKA
jgi:hypothetical protein